MITAEDGNVLVTLPLEDGKDGLRLVIRYDADGEQWVSIRRAE